LLDQLGEAAKGAVDDMTLMSGVATLLAGTSDELGKKLGDATPQLLKIAKAANKLNPQLGDTAFMFQSISTGVKRAQPLILDNLGLTIKVGAANEAMAAELGKSVEALTAEEKAMAILNDTLRAGDLLIAQVGGTVDSATDAFSRNEAMIKNLTDEMSTSLAPAVSRIVTRFNELLPPLLDWLEVMPEATKAFEDGKISAEEYEVVIGMAAMADGDLALATDYLKLKIAQQTERMEEANLATDGWMAGLVDLRLRQTEATEATEAATNALANEKAATDLLSISMSGYTDKLLFNKAAALLDAEASLTLAYNMGLVDDKAYIAGLALAENEDGIIDNIERTGEYIREVLALQTAMKSVEGTYHATIDLRINVGLTRTVKTITVPIPGEEPYVIPVPIPKDIADLEDWERRAAGLPVDEKHQGGPVTSGSPYIVGERGPELYIVGERGPELFVPNSSGKIIPNDRLGATSGAPYSSPVQQRRSSRGGDRTQINFYRYGDTVNVQTPAYAAWIVEQQHQAEFDEIGSVI